MNFLHMKKKRWVFAYEKKTLRFQLSLFNTITVYWPVFRKYLRPIPVIFKTKCLDGLDILSSKRALMVVSFVSSTYPNPKFVTKSNYPLRLPRAILMILVNELLHRKKNHHHEWFQNFLHKSEKKIKSHYYKMTAWRGPTN